MGHLLRILLTISAILCAWVVVPDVSQATGRDCVVLLHGMGRTKHSMNKMERHLKSAEYEVVNFDYPSRKHKIEELTGQVLPKTIELCREYEPPKIHFVTHSLGGIMVRYYLKAHEMSDLGKVVMLSPPNKGSEVVDKLRGNFIFRAFNGPAGLQLGTEAGSIPNSLGRVDFNLGVITGDRTINLILSTMIPGDDDGKVAIINAKVEGMRDFLVVHSSHPFIMKNAEVIAQTIHFLQQGKFSLSE